MTRRIEREAATVYHMLQLSCRARHGCTSGLCDDCVELWHYVQERLASCPFRDDKPTCQDCTVHCFRPAMRDRIRDVMRYAGPRMAWRHPVLSMYHLIDSRRSPRSKTGRRTARQKPDR